MRARTTRLFQGAARLRSRTGAIAPSRDAVPQRSDHPLYEDLFLLAIDPESGALWRNTNEGVSAAVLVELVRAGRVRVTEGRNASARVELLADDPIGYQAIDDVLMLMSAGRFSPHVSRLADTVSATMHVAGSLIAQGKITEGRRRVLGLVPVRSYQPTPTGRREAVAARVRSALLGESVPDERTASLIGLLDITVPLRFLVPKGQRREAERRSAATREQLPREEQVLLAAVFKHITDHD